MPDYWPLQQLVVMTLLFTLPGVLPSLALLGRSWLVLPVAPLLSAVLASVAGVAMLLLDVEQLPAWVVAVLLVNGAAAARLRSVRRPSARAGTNLLAVGLVVAGAVAPLIALRRPDVAWDARSIWLLHARWFFGGPDVLEASLANPAFDFSHSSYPPLVSSSAALTWQVVGFQPEAYRLAQLLFAGLTACALVAVGLTLVLAASRRWSLLAGLMSVLVSLSAYGFAGRFTASGYVDLLWAAAAAAAALLLLAGPPTPQRCRAALLLAVVAGLTKNEGTGIAALLVCGLAIVAWRRRDRAMTAQAGAALLLVLMWPLAARPVVPDVGSAEATRTSVGESAYALEIVAHWVGPLAVAALLLAVVAWAYDRSLTRATAGMLVLAIFAAVAVAFAQMRMGFFRSAVQPEQIRDAAWVLDHTQRYYTFSRLLLAAALAHGVVRLLQVVRTAQGPSASELWEGSPDREPDISGASLMTERC